MIYRLHRIRAARRIHVLALGMLVPLCLIMSGPSLAQDLPNGDTGSSAPAATVQAPDAAAPDSGGGLPPASAPDNEAPSVADPSNTITGTEIPAPMPADDASLPSDTAETAASVADAASAEPPVENIVLHDLSPWGMYQQADIVVKAVMISLIIASILTWTVLLAKSLELTGAKARVRRALATVSRARSTHEAAASNRLRGTGALLLSAAVDEMDTSDDLPADGIKERILASLTRIEARAARRMTRGMGILATTGAIAPFVGLFGTVWGIMNSFIGIAESQTTNLAVVAPGIAEALLATAIGLVAAIPAVVIYNAFTRSIGGYRALLSDTSAEILRHVSRDLDRRDMPHMLAAAAE